jgi:hypothetical protein
MTRALSLILFVFVVGGWTTPARAKVFNVSQESFAAYVAGTWGPSFENTLSSKSNSTSSVPVTIDANHRYNLSGEFGFLYARPSANLRFGLEVLHPLDIKEQSATNSSGTSLYTLTNEISVLIPKVDLEIILKHWSDVRLFLVAGAGYGNLAARNAYSFTSAGSSAYSLANFDEDLRGNAPMYEGALGIEGLLSDMTTYVLQAGYRSLKFDQIKHNRDATTFQGSVVKGDPATNMDGSSRTIDLSNYFVGVSFRFWLH